MKHNRWLTVVMVLPTLMLSACGAATREQQTQIALATASALEAARLSAASADESTDEISGATDTTVAQVATAPEADVSYTLITGGGTGSLVFVGQGGDIDGVVNPALTADPGQTVAITVINGDGIQHDLTIDEFGVQTNMLENLDDQQTVVFTVDEEGEYVYYCSMPGHRQAGMFGSLVVGNPEPVTAQGENIIHNPADIPGPIGEREPQTVQVDLVAQEITGQLADGTTYDYYTFNGSVPGPFIRVQVGDTIELSLTNPADNHMPHSIDLHAVTGPGGGAVYTSTNPGETTSFSFQTLKTGLYVYHCATPSVAHHISNGMYGLILVEPEGGLPPVDHEFYVMQGEIYTEQPYGTPGHLDFSDAKLLNETPEYFVFNGAAGALTGDDNALYASVGDTIRIFFGVGGPNKTSSFHVIGEMFDRAWLFGSLATPPMEDVQTITVPPGDAGMVEITLEVPGRYILVDHALSRLERGLAGFLYVDGDEHPEIFAEGIDSAGQ